MIQKFNYCALLLIIFTLTSCDGDDNKTVDSTAANFEITIGNAQPIEFTGTCYKVSDEIYQISASSEQDLSLVIKWHSTDPEGTFAWNVDSDISDEDIWLAMATEDLNTQYYSYDVETGAMTENSSGLLKIEKFGNVNGFVEGTFTADNAFLIELSGGTATKTNVKMTAKFKIKREL